MENSFSILTLRKYFPKDFAAGLHSWSQLTLQLQLTSMDFPKEAKISL